MWHSVGDNQVLQFAVVDLLDSVAAENTVSDNGDGSLGAVLDDNVSSLAKGTAGVGHVIDDDSCAIFDIADKNHAADFVRAGTLLVDESEADVEVVGNGSRPGGELSVTLFR